MKCPNCKYSLLGGNICPNCGIDIVLFEKTLKVSDVLYNKGLNLAKIRDLSGAVDSLTKSIQFNKNNYYARNLLGLTYYEVGRIGDALKQWVISASLMKKENVAAKYINRVQRDPKLLDMFEAAVENYNNALSYLQQKSDDMAIIQLKKAIELNPNFVDAMNLLTFCCLIQDDRELAGVLVENVLEIDINNAIALNYYNELYPNRVRTNTAPKKETPKPVNPALTAPKVTMSEPAHNGLFSSHFFFAEVVSFVIGGLCTFALVYFLIMPGTVSEKDAEITRLTDQITVNQTEAELTESEKDEQIKSLTEEVNTLKIDNAKLNDAVASQDKSTRLETANRLYQEGNAVDAAATIYDLDPTGFDELSLALYNELKENTYATAASELYNSGLDDFNAENNEDARRAFETLFRYAPEDAVYRDSATYYLGVLAERASNIETAIKYYNAVITDYPNSDRLNQARNRLDELEVE